MDDYVVCFHLDVNDDFEMDVSFFHHHNTSNDDMWPWRVPPIPSRA
jgi:hypothetical protein